MSDVLPLAHYVHGIELAAALVCLLLGGAALLYARKLRRNVDESEDNEPVFCFIRLAIMDALRCGADGIVLGIPDDSLPREARLKADKEAPRITIDDDVDDVSARADRIMEELIQDARETLESGDLSTWAVKMLPVPVSSRLQDDQIPVWYRVRNVWKQQSGIPCKLFPGVLDACYEIATVHPDGKDLERKYIRVSDYADRRQYVEVRCCFGANCGFSIDIVRTFDVPIMT